MSNDRDAARSVRAGPQSRPSSVHLTHRIVDHVLPATSGPGTAFHRPGRAISCIVAAAVGLGGCLPGGPSTGVSPVVARADSIARAAIASEQSIDPATFPERSVGVAPLMVQVTDPSLAPLGWGLADLLTTDLARSRELRVVERLNVDALMRELARSTGGRVESASAPRVGRLMGARQIVTGAIAQLPDSRLVVSTRVADVLRGEVRSAASPTMELDRILDAQKELAFALFDRLGVTLTPAERAAVEQRPTRNITALLAYSRGVRDEAFGNFASAAEQYREAVRLDPAFGQAQTKLQDAEVRIGEAAASGGGATGTIQEGDQLKRAASLAADAVNRPMLPPTADAADPSFRASTMQLVTLIIRVTIP
jgi:TolB-like protein